MSEKQESHVTLQRIVKSAAESNVGEAILNIFKAGLATAPLFGGIASLMTDYIPSSRLKRLEQFASDVAEDLKKVTNQVNSDYLKTDDFAFMFEKCFRGAAENPQKEKVAAFRGILVNSAIRRDYSEEEKEYFLNLANNLSALHIRILRFMYEPNEYLEDSGISLDRIRGGFSQFFPVAIPGVDMGVIRSAFGELHRFGLVNTDQSIFSTMTAGQGLDLLGGRITALGERFIKFCVSPAH
jgi:hypothetical protein